MKQLNVLIAGQGIAGSLLAWKLLQRNIPVTVVDDNPLYNATKVAAGIIIPITGRRLAKTHLADWLIPEAFATYRQIEKQSGTTFFHQKDVLEVFSSGRHLNEWYARSSDHEMEGYCSNILTAEKMPENINQTFGGIVLKRSGYVNTATLTGTIAAMLKDKNAYYVEELKYPDIVFNSDSASWNGMEYSHIIFCEGYKATRNPYFTHVPFKPAKGEIIDFRINGFLSEEYIISSGIYVLPLGNGCFRAGATYEWNQLTEDITPDAREYLGKNLSKTITCNFEITGQQAGIRPAMIDRRPCLGMHPKFNCIGMFNGLGTKGALLAPYYANMMTELIATGKDPGSDVSIRRFDRFYQAP